jgi:hypothetical protein
VLLSRKATIFRRRASISARNKDISFCNTHDVLTAVVIMSSVFLDIILCSPLKVNRHFGEACCLHLQGQGINQARNQHKFFGLLSVKPNLCEKPKTFRRLRFPPVFTVTCVAYFSTQKMEAVSFSEMSENSRTTCRYIPEDSTPVFCLWLYRRSELCFTLTKRLVCWDSWGTYLRSLYEYWLTLQLTISLQRWMYYIWYCGLSWLSWRKL